ncbi:hypothetical protein ACQKWADRAFT_288513 [Trichoderma austrokoningii]
MPPPLRIPLITRNWMSSQSMRLSGTLQYIWTSMPQMTQELIPKPQWPLVSKLTMARKRESKKKTQKSRGSAAYLARSPPVLGLDIWPTPPQQTSRFLSQPMWLRQLNNTYIYTCPSPYTYIMYMPARMRRCHLHAPSGIKTILPARAKQAKEPLHQGIARPMIPFAPISPSQICCFHPSKPTGTSKVRYQRGAATNALREHTYS